MDRGQTMIPVTLSLVFVPSSPDYCDLESSDTNSCLSYTGLFVYVELVGGCRCRMAEVFI